MQRPTTLHPPFLGQHFNSFSRKCDPPDIKIIRLILKFLTLALDPSSLLSIQIRNNWLNLSTFPTTQSYTGKGRRVGGGEEREEGEGGGGREKGEEGEEGGGEDGGGEGRRE